MRDYNDNAIRRAKTPTNATRTKSPHGSADVRELFALLAKLSDEDRQSLLGMLDEKARGPAE